MSDWLKRLDVRRWRDDDDEPKRLATADEHEQLATDWSKETPSDVLLAAGLIRLLTEGRLIERAQERER